MEFKDRIRELRKKLNLTQAEFAETVKISPRQYQSFELGTHKPGFDNLIALADALHVSLDYLMCRTDVNNPPD